MVACYSVLVKQKAESQWSRVRSPVGAHVKRFSSRAHERTCGMVRGKTRGTHSISNLLFSLFKIGLLPATQNSGGCGGDMGGRSSRAGREEVWSDVDSKARRRKFSSFCYLQGKLDFLWRSCSSSSSLHLSRVCGLSSSSAPHPPTSLYSQCKNRGDEVCVWKRAW